MAAIYSVTRDREEVRQGEIEHISILRAIEAYRLGEFCDAQIADLLTKQFGIIRPYAVNYIDEYDRELAKHILPWQKR